MFLGRCVLFGIVKRSHHIDQRKAFISAENLISPAEMPLTDLDRFQVTKTDKRLPIPMVRGVSMM